MNTLSGAGQVGARGLAREPHVPGEQGTWVFIFGDMSVFATLFATYLFYRGQEASSFAESQKQLNQDFGAVNTVLLLISSLLVVSAVRAVRSGEKRPAPPLILGAIGCGLAFSALKVLEYSDKIAHGITPTSNSFFMHYFVLTGLHWFHLAIGIAVLILMLVLSRKPSMTPKQLVLFEGSACFWHMVDLLWIVLFPLLYLVR